MGQHGVRIFETFDGPVRAPDDSVQMRTGGIRAIDMVAGLALAKDLLTRRSVGRSINYAKGRFGRSRLGPAGAGFGTGNRIGQCRLFVAAFTEAIN